VRVFHAQNILRPQLSFEDKSDNSRRPWVPILTEKHFAKVPFQPGTVAADLAPRHPIAPLIIPPISRVVVRV